MRKARDELEDARDNLLHRLGHLADSPLGERVFQRNFDTRQAMSAWLTERFQQAANPVLLLHDDPLYVVGRYLGFAPNETPPNIMERATRFARDQGWDKIADKKG